MEAWEWLVAGLLARRAGRGVAVVGGSSRVMAVGGCQASFSTPWRFASSLSSARSHYFSLSAVTFDLNVLNARVAGTLVASRLALVVLALQCFVASVIAGGTVPVAAFLVARVPSTVSQLLAFDLASVHFPTLNLLRFRTTAARFVHHLVALRASSSVASLRTSMTAASQSLAASITACRGSFGAREIIVRLAAGAVPCLGQWTRGAPSLVADQIAVVESAAKFLAAIRVAIPQRICAGPVFLRLAAVAGLDTGSRARRTVAGMAIILALMLVAVKVFVAFLAASPKLVRTSPHGGLAVAAVAAIPDSLWTRGAGPGVAKHDAFMLATFQRPPTFLAAGVRCHPRVKNWIYLLGAVAGVPVRNLPLCVLTPTFRTAPCVADRRSAVNISRTQIRIFLKQLLLLKDGIFSPALDAGDVEAHEAGDAAPDGFSPLDVTDADETGGGVKRVVQSIFGDLENTGISVTILS